MLCGEATNTNFIVFGLTQSGLEPTIYHSRGEHANHYTTDVVHWSIELHVIYFLNEKLVPGTYFIGKFIPPM